MYFAIGICLTILSLIELIKKKYQDKVFILLIFFLTLLLAFRYGQGTDYYGYYRQYVSVKFADNIFENILYHGEWGWYVLMFLSNKIGLSYEMFIALISFVMMCGIFRVINKYSPYKMISLLIFYPTFYLTYCFSALRQGLVMCLFLGFGLELLLKKAYLRYILLVMILITFHKSAIVLLVLPIALQFKGRKVAKWIIVVPIIVAILEYIGIINNIANNLGVSSYYRYSPSYLAIIARLFLFYVMSKMHKEYVKKFQQDFLENTLYIIYVCGFFIYISLAFTDTLSQRLSMPMKAIEIILLPILVKKMHYMESIKVPMRVMYLKIKSIKILLMLIAVIAMLNIEIVKNINSYIVQGNYYSWVNIINYPYSNIFDKDKIQKYISHFNGEID